MVLIRPGWLSVFMNALTRARCLLGLFVEGLNPPLELDHQRVAFAVYLVADGYLDPAFADAVLGDVVAFFVVKADADVVLKDGSDEVRAALVGREVVGQRWAFCCVGFFGHGVKKELSELNGSLRRRCWRRAGRFVR
jgi:hypothetical protein